ncbi:hypothetical protein [Modicisalibacter coralii]|uniref:hypothetical protein n=1 Tax=Modicisalibacter coralii TaxID=2304602 RepID=UPI00100BA358|nr:hypothetical protein [Halomonas coralii]
MAKQYRTALIIEGDARGGIRAIQATDDQLQNLNRRFDDSSRRSRQMSDDIDNAGESLDTLKDIALGAGAALAGMFAVGNLAEQAKMIQQTDALARSIGVSTQRLQEWQYASKSVGMDAENIGGIMKDVADKIGDAYRNGGGEAIDALETLNLQAADLIKLSPDETILKIAEGLQQLDRYSQVNILESLGDDAVLLQPLLENNAEALKQYASMARSLGVAMDQVDIDKAVDAALAMNQLEGVATGLTNTLIADLGPGLTSATNNLTTLIDQIGGADEVLDVLMTTVGTLATVYLARRLGPGLLSVGRSGLVAGGHIAEGMYIATGAAGRLNQALVVTQARIAATAAAGRALTGALSLVGGPAGVAMLAVAGIAAYHEELDEMLAPAERATQRVNDLTNAINLNSEAAIKGQLVNLTGQMVQLEQQAAAARQQLEEINASSSDPGPFRNSMVLGQDAEKRREAYETLRKVREELDANGQASDKLRERLSQLNEQSVDTISTISDLGSATDEAAKTAGEYDNSLQSLLDTLYPAQKSQREYQQAIDLLTTAYMRGDISQQRYMDGLDKIDQQFQSGSDWAEAYGMNVETAAQQAADAADPMGVIWERTLERMDDAGVSMWRGFLDGTGDAMDQFEDLVLDSVAEVAHKLITQPLTMSISAAITGESRSSQQAGGGMGGLGDLASLGKNVYSGIADGFGAVNWFGAPTSYTSGFGSQVATGGLQSGQGFMNQGFLSNGSMSNFSGLTGLASLGAGMLGNYVGSQAGESLTGKQANSNIGSTVLGTAGTLFAGPVGGFLGSAAGSVIDAALGSSPPELDLSLRRRPAEAYADRPNWDEGVRSVGAFGTLGLDEDGTHDINSLWSPEQAQQLFDGLAQLDNALAALADTPEQLQAMTDAVMSPDRHGMQGHYGETSHASNVVRILTSRYKDALDPLNLAFEDTILAFEGGSEELVGVATNLKSVEDTVGDNAQAMADARAALADSDDIVATAQQLATQAQAMQTLSQAADRLNLRFDETAVGAMAAAGKLAEMAGGLGNLQSLQQQYYATWTTDEQQLADLRTDLTEQLASVGIDAVPKSAAAVRDLVGGIDTMTEAGREQLLTIYQLTPTLKSYTDAMSEQRTAAEEAAEAISNERWSLQNELLKAQGKDTELLNRQRERELAGLDESNRALQRRIWSLQDEAKAQEAAEAAREAAQEAAREREALLTRTGVYTSGIVGSVSDALSIFNESSSTLDDIAETRQAQLEDEHRAITSLGDLLDSLSTSDLAIGSSLDAAQRQYDRLYARARGGDAGVIDDYTSAARDYLDLYQQNASTALDYARVYAGVTSGVAGLQDQFEDSVDATDDVGKTAARQLREQERTNYTLLDSLNELVTQNASLNSIADLIDTLPAGMASTLSDLFPEYGTDVGESGFNASAYLANKTAQVNASHQGGRGDWTVEQVLAAIEQAGMTPYEHYQRYGRDEGVLPTYDPDGGAGSAQSANRFNESRYLANYLDYLQERDAGERSWTSIGQVVDAFSDSGMTPYEHWMRYGRAEGVPAYAAGGLHGGGWALVGEQGPEYVDLGPSRIYNALETQQLMDLPAPGALPPAILPPMAMDDRAARRDDEAIVRALQALTDRAERSEQRLEVVSRAAAKMAQILRRWDYDGLPEVRELVETVQ